jgi:hypothetical protein
MNICRHSAARGSAVQIISASGAFAFCQSIKKMAWAYFWLKCPYTNCLQPYQMVEENRIVRNTKICISDNPQMIHADIPHR